MPYDVEAVLSQHKVKPTPQRCVIADYLINEDTHPTADEVFEAVSDKLPVKLSRATVYNTLKTLVDAKILLEVSTQPGVTRYDANLTEHHHFVDTETGQIYDIPWENVSQLCQSLGKDFQINDYRVTFWGKYSGK